MHEAIEEQFFWPAVRDALDGGDELADQALEQEQADKKLLVAISRRIAASCCQVRRRGWSLPVIGMNKR